MTINWPTNSRKKRAVIKGGQSQGELSGRALQGSAKGLVLFNIFITNLKGEGRLHKNEICRWLLITEDLQTPGRAGMKFRGSLGKVVGKGQRRLESRETMNLRQELPCSGLKGISGCRDSGSVLATTVVNTSNPCLLGNTHIVLGGWPGKVKGYETVFR